MEPTRNVIHPRDPIYRDSRAASVFAQLPKALERHEALLCCTRNAIPGVPTFEPEREWVNGTYTVLSPWGPVERIYGSDLGAHGLYAYDFYRPKGLGTEVPAPHMPTAGHAELDLATGIVSVHQDDADEAVYHTRVIQLDGKRGTDVLKQVRIDLARAGIPVYPQALYTTSSLPYPWREGRSFLVPRAFNDEAAARLVGYALDPETAQIVYLHIAGPKTALRSIWGTLNNAGRHSISLVTGDRHVSGYSGYSSAYDTFAEPVDADTNLYHMIVTDERVTEQQVEERAYLIVPEKGQLDISQAFAARLNAVLPIPVLPHWGRELRDRGRRDELFAPCPHGGDVADAYAIERSEGWIELIEQLIQGGELTLSDEA